jgi:hypothetical protein
MARDCDPPKVTVLIRLLTSNIGRPLLLCSGKVSEGVSYDLLIVVTVPHTISSNSRNVRINATLCEEWIFVIHINHLPLSEKILHVPR